MINSKELYKMLGHYVSEMREQAGFKQVEVARQLGFSAQFYGRIEKGEVPIPHKSLILLVSILGLNKQVVERIFRTALISTLDEIFNEGQARKVGLKKKSLR
jgi:transcriptional regulator with XRE-family HTH domain